MPPPPLLHINPPLLNSANPWATDLSHLLPLYASPHTGAVTTRTSTLHGYPHDDAINQYTFFSPLTQTAASPATTTPTTAAAAAASLNTLGYSPHPLSTYLSFISTISAAATASGGANYGLRTDKPIIISVTGTPADVASCHRLIRTHARRVCMPLAMEVNLSCPNIAGVPAAYSRGTVNAYVEALAEARAEAEAEAQAGGKRVVVVVGLKTPPFTHAGMFDEFVGALAAGVGRAGAGACPVGFVTAVNTLAPALVLGRGGGGKGALEPVLRSASGLGLGGMAGAPLHPLALGNVLSLKQALGRVEGLAGVMVIGVGGVEDADGWRRMRRVGAEAVGVGTALGRFGVGVFERIWRGVEGAKL
ncbi:putative dihydroorotate dehydrogenase A (fumarate) [Diplodia seriata]|uniref:Putative dihydroorotate dehydrogenase A (Fumarate) n=1 Tax=Diplodia seriata TaxID=420778 RepID=A0A1S8BLV4_9PEZI|nr:putative dihydroorotate dehydrogenase A (fumarate) [Diplodia seriata]